MQRTTRQTFRYWVFISLILCPYSFPSHISSTCCCSKCLPCPFIHTNQDLDAANGEDGDKSGIQDLEDADDSKDKGSAQEKDRVSAEEAKEDTPQVMMRCSRAARSLNASSQNGYPAFILMCLVSLNG